MSRARSPFGELIDHVNRRRLETDSPYRPKRAAPEPAPVTDPQVRGQLTARASPGMYADSSPLGALVDEIRARVLSDAARRPTPPRPAPDPRIPPFVPETGAATKPTGSGGRRGLLLPVSAALHAILAGAVIVIPILRSDELPPPTAGGLKAFFVQPVSAPPPPPPPPAAAPASRPVPKSLSTEPPKFTAPSDVPLEVKPEQGLETGVPGGVAGGVEGGVPGGVVGGVVGGLPEVAPTPHAPVRVGGAIPEPKQLKWVEPVYPDLARRSGVEGIIVIECTIDPTGRVSHARVLRGVPILDDAALAAVKQWVFTPTLLGGAPIPVLMTVTVRFNLRRPARS